MGLYKSSIRLIPTNEMVDVLTVRKKEPPKILPGSWVRLKRGVYSGDLAEVCAFVSQRGERERKKRASKAKKKQTNTTDIVWSFRYWLCAMIRELLI